MAFTAHNQQILDVSCVGYSPLDTPQLKALKDKQVATLKAIYDYALPVSDQVDQQIGYGKYLANGRISNVADPTLLLDCVNKGYCDRNSKQSDKDTSQVGAESGANGFLGGLLGGALSGIGSSLLTSTDKLSALASTASTLGSLASGAGSLVGSSLRSGTQGAWQNAKASNPPAPGSDAERLIDNVATDNLNGGGAYNSGSFSVGGSLMARTMQALGNGGLNPFALL